MNNIYDNNNSNKSLNFITALLVATSLTAIIYCYHLYVKYKNNNVNVIVIPADNYISEDDIRDAANESYQDFIYNN